MALSVPEVVGGERVTELRGCPVGRLATRSLALGLTSGFLGLVLGLAGASRGWFRRGGLRLASPCRGRLRRCALGFGKPARTENQLHFVPTQLRMVQLVHSPVPPVLVCSPAAVLQRGKDPRVGVIPCPHSPQFLPHLPRDKEDIVSLFADSTENPVPTIDPVSDVIPPSTPRIPERVYRPEMYPHAKMEFHGKAKIGLFPPRHEIFDKLGQIGCKVCRVHWIFEHEDVAVPNTEHGLVLQEHFSRPKTSVKSRDAPSFPASGNRRPMHFK